MDVLQAVRWAIGPWEQNITEITIQNCWYKSSLLKGRVEYGDSTLSKRKAKLSGWTEYAAEDAQAIVDAEANILKSMKKLEDQKRIKSVMNIHQFLNPTEEQIVDPDIDVLENIVATYSTGPATERGYETDESDHEEPPIKGQEALDMLARLRLYEEQQEHGDSEVLKVFGKYERDIRARNLQGLRQASIQTFFGRT